MDEQDLFLSKPQLVDLTGFKHTRKQIRFLSDNGIPFAVTALGRPVVLRESVRIILGPNDPSPPRGRRGKPDFSLI